MLASAGGSAYRPRDPAHGHRPHLLQLLPTLRTGTGGHLPDPSAPQRPKHGPAALGDGCQVGRPSPRGRRRLASGRKVAPVPPACRPAPSAAHRSLRALQAAVPAFTLCGPAEVPSTRGFAQRGPAPPLFRKPPEHLCPWHRRIWGHVAQPLSVGFVAAMPRPPAPAGQSPGCPVTLMINSGLPSKYCCLQMHSCWATRDAMV